MAVVGPDTLTPIPDEGGPELSLPFPEPPAAQSVLAPGAGNYRLWRAWAKTRGKSGWKPMAAAGDDSQQPVACRLVKLHAAITRIVVFYEAVRQGAWPELPDPRGPVAADPNLTLEWWEDRVSANVGPNAADYLTRARGKRVYACTVPVYGWVSGLLVPAPPCCTASRGTLNVPPNKFVTGII
jgi:hypothetical protein